MSQAELETLLRAAPPAAPDRLRARVHELRAQPQRRPALELRRLALPALAAVLFAAVGAAVVHGLVGEGRKQAAPLETHPAAVRHALAPATGSAGPLQAVPAVPAPAGHVPPLGGGDRLTQYAASLRVRVDGTGRLSGATGAATRIARSFGGYAASVDYRTPQGRPAQAFLELRIPTQDVQAALAKFGALGTILSQRVSTHDLESQLERQTAQIASLREEIRLTLAALRDPTLSPLDRIRLRLKLDAAKRALGQRLHARKGTIASGTLARISLVLTTEQAQAAAPHRESRLDGMLGSAASFLGLEGTVALYVLIVVSPFLPLLALAWYLRRRRDDRLLAASRP